MTRETKIGLLVGLAFIIVIGILLSDHLSSSGEPPSATLVQAGSNVRQQVATPAGTQPPVQAVMPPAVVVPTNPIATQRDLTPPTVPTAVVQVGPLTPSVAAPVVVQVNKAVETSVPAEPPVTLVNNTAAPVTIEQRPAEPGQPAPVELAGNSEPVSPLGKIAAQHGEPLVTSSGQPVSMPVTAKVAGGASVGKEYVIQPGDTLSKLATRFLGANTKANRDLIIKANPSLSANPDRLIVGRSYKMPAAVNAAAMSTPPATVTVATVPEALPIGKTAPAQLAADTMVFYTVKPGDSLWKIAAQQLGTGGKGVAAIKELNNDVLNGGEVVTVDMKLRMPGKLLAAAN